MLVLKLVFPAFVQSYWFKEIDLLVLCLKKHLEVIG
ncbi:hypothetical protein CLV24_11943 [Pontibacter ummariensis]|uniref:Uncharacterized protein n=1 Tax=Pontibacter ummariensis TaxID=1610492 RepID=A0A239IWB3_9BACT|nr:hypothetical protein CLV24_11943 [Pontibacter ummariensis]SNS97849.1 hypothetical protein SAMN06296052_11943 [Pontibacter ummariensis]